MKKYIFPTFVILCISTVVLLFAHANMSKATIGRLVVTKTSAFTGAATLTGGVTFATVSSVIWSRGGSVALATAGTDQAPTNGAR